MTAKKIFTGYASLMSIVVPAFAQQDAAPPAAPTPAVQGAVVASPDDVQQSQKVIVSASKSRPQILIEAPMSVQAFTGKDLAAKNIANIDALITAVPGATQSEQLGEFIRSYSIRGSGSGGGIGDAMVGYYVDETAYVTPNVQLAPPLRLLDIDQVEVLRGPYGTLYGQAQWAEQ